MGYTKNQRELIASGAIKPKVPAESQWEAKKWTCRECGQRRPKLNAAYMGCCSLDCYSAFMSRPSEKHKEFKHLAGAPTLTKEEIKQTWKAEVDPEADEKITKRIYELAQQLREFETQGDYRPGMEEDLE